MGRDAVSTKMLNYYHHQQHLPTFRNDLICSSNKIDGEINDSPKEENVSLEVPGATSQMLSSLGRRSGVLLLHGRRGETYRKRGVETYILRLQSIFAEPTGGGMMLRGW